MANGKEDPDLLPASEKSDFERFLQEELRPQIDAPDFEELTKRGRARRDEILGELRTRELQARETLLERRQTARAAIDAQLQELLSQSGIQTEQEAAETGAALAARGLGRSTAAVEAQDVVQARGLERRAGLRQQAAQQRQNVEEATIGRIEQLDRRREQLRLQGELSAIRRAEDFSFAFKREDIRQAFQSEIAEAELSAQEEAAFLGLAGDVLGGLGGSIIPFL